MDSFIPILRRISVRNRLRAFAALGLLALVVSTAVAVWMASRLTQISERVFVAKDVVADILPPPMYLIELRLVASRLVEGTLDARQARAEVERLAGEYDARVAHWSANAPFGLEGELLGAQHEAARPLIAAARALVQRAESGPAGGLRAPLIELDRLYGAHRDGVDRTVKAGTAFAAQSESGFADVVAGSRRWLFAALAGSAALLLALSAVIARSIVAPLQSSIDSIGRFAGGDLSAAPDASGRDELSNLGRSLRHMSESLGRVVGTVRGGADSVATASGQIASGNTDLSRRTEQQASALQQTAATMEELGSTVRHNADSARHADELARSASQVAQDGGEVVGRVVRTMKDIHAGSRRIAEIIGTIDDIAFQTNILALNAAVEAARAGEQGRGFAVVAAEVRSLAQRSAGAAKEIKRLISSSVEQVEQGSALTDAAGAKMQEVVAAIKRVSDLVGEIAGATREQSDGVAQVGSAVSEMDRATQQNAALVEESAAAAASLRQQAEQLVQAVAGFRLANDARMAAG